MTRPIRLIVTDTSPLITLVLADALDSLLLSGAEISVPDAVFVEATRVKGAPGAEEIVNWINDHADRVRIVPTSIGIDQQRRIEEERSTRGLGEQAAIEVLDRHFRVDPATEAILLYEDTDLSRRSGALDARVILISTGDFLRELEAAGLLQSADFILDSAAEQGRRVERQRLSVSRPEDVQRFGESLRSGRS